MSDKMRSDFEAFKESHSRYLDVFSLETYEDGDYVDADVQLAWEAFQASRASLSIELPELIEPEPPEDAFDDSWRDGYAAADRYRKKCRAAIESTGLGIKVK